MQHLNQKTNAVFIFTTHRTPAWFHCISQGKESMIQQLEKLLSGRVRTPIGGGLILLVIVGIIVFLINTGKKDELKSRDLLANILDRGIIRVSTDPNFAPQSLLKPDGTFEGFDIDVAAEIARRLGVTVEFVVPGGWDMVTAGAWGNQWDMSVGSMTITRQRAEVLRFTPGYYFSSAQFATRREAGIATIDDIHGKTVCVGAATTYQTYLTGQDIGIPGSDLKIPLIKAARSTVPACMIKFPGSSKRCMRTVRSVSFPKSGLTELT